VRLDLDLTGGNPRLSGAAAAAGSTKSTAAANDFIG